MPVPAPEVTTASRARTGHASQDRHLIASGAVAVLDGATHPDEPQGRDGGWYADQLVTALEGHLTARQDGDLADVVSDALTQVVTTEELSPGRSPSSTLSILRWTGDRVEAYVLGDSPIVIAHHDGTHTLVTDPRLSAMTARNRAEYQHLLRCGAGFGGEVAALGVQVREQTRRARNTSDGYWIAEAAPVAAYQAIRQTFPRNTIREALLCTDGASAAIDVFGLFPDWRSLLAHVHAHGLPSLMTRLSEAAASDPTGQLYPRRNCDDDATAVHVRFPR